MFSPCAGEEFPFIKHGSVSEALPGRLGIWPRGDVRSQVLTVPFAVTKPVCFTVRLEA